MSRQAYRAALAHRWPTRPARARGRRLPPDGLLVVEDGHVAAFGAYADLAPSLGGHAGRPTCPAG
jgi:hypothetical protein